MSKAVFDKNYKVTGAFDPSDKWWYRIEGVEETDSKIVTQSQNGTMILKGAFTSDEAGEQTIGELNEVIFKTPSGNKIVVLSGLDVDFAEITDLLYEADYWPTQDQAWEISDILLTDLSRIDLSDKNDRTEEGWLDDSGSIKVYGKGGDDLIFGGNGKDKLFGDGGNDTLRGAENKDKLQGGSGGDLLKGGSGNDTLLGGKGADSLSGDGGDDILRGNAGDDVFFFSSGDGKADRIVDFMDGEDMIRIGKGASGFEDLTLKSAGEDVKVKFANVVFYVENMAKSDLTEDDFLF